MFMLVYPFTFYAANGLSKLLSRWNTKSRRISGLAKVGVICMVGVTVLLSFVYLATPILMNTVKVGVFYLPNVSAHFCSAPAVPYQDVGDVTQAFSWLDGNMAENSCSIVNDY